MSENLEKAVNMRNSPNSIDSVYFSSATKNDSAISDLHHEQQQLLEQNQATARTKSTHDA